MTEGGTRDENSCICDETKSVVDDCRRFEENIGTIRTLNMVDMMEMVQILKTIDGEDDEDGDDGEDDEDGGYDEVGEDGWCRC